MHLTSHNLIGGVVKYAVDVLVVGGGGGGPNVGGGGGQVRTISMIVQKGTPLSVIIGAGGNSSNGTASSIGSESAAPGRSDGYSASGKAPGSAASYHGYYTDIVGDLLGEGTSYANGGGAGDSTAGNNASAGYKSSPPAYPWAVGGKGGDGTASTLSGASTYYGGGAGGSGDAGSGSSGLGGGGTANTGGGGRPTGGSGIVIVRYPGTAAKMSGGAITLSGGYVYHTFTSSGVFTA